MDIRTAFYFAEHAEKIVFPSNAGPLEERLNPKKFRKCNGGLQFLTAGFPQVQVFGTFFFAIVIFLLLLR
jgi:hypothetical protein